MNRVPLTPWIRHGNNEGDANGHFHAADCATRMLPPQRNSGKLSAYFKGGVGGFFENGCSWSRRRSTRECKERGGGPKYFQSHSCVPTPQAISPPRFLHSLDCYTAPGADSPRPAFRNNNADPTNRMAQNAFPPNPRTTAAVHGVT